MGTLDSAELRFFSDLQGILSRRPRALPRRITRVCGVDASYDGERVFAAACLFERGRLSEEAVCSGRWTFPYVSGLFYLREGPFVVEAVRRLGVRPQLVCFDAHGAAHPRSAGLATVCGMVLGIPTVGIAKSALVRAVSASEGLGEMTLGKKTVGFVTSRGGAKRYWSPGYSVTLAGLRRVIETQASVCLEALREADRASRRARAATSRPG